jgi:hypothetical protein
MKRRITESAVDLLLAADLQEDNRPLTGEAILRVARAATFF